MHNYQTKITCSEFFLFAFFSHCTNIKHKPVMSPGPAFLPLTTRGHHLLSSRTPFPKLHSPVTHYYTLSCSPLSQTTCSALTHHYARLFPHLPDLPFHPFKLPVFAVRCWYVSHFFPDVCLELCPACSLDFPCLCLLSFWFSPSGWFDLCLFSVIRRIKPILCI